METMNHDLFLLINGLAGNRYFDLLFSGVAVASPYFFAFILLAFFIAGKRDAALYASYAAVLALLVNQLLAVFYFHPRPFMIGLGHALVRHAPETSFPSDHASLAFAVAFSFLLSKESRAGAALLLLAVLTGFARVYCGLHFPLDVAGSVVVGLVAALIVFKFRERFLPLNALLNRWFVFLSKKMKRGEGLPQG